MSSPSPLLQELISLCGVRPGAVASTARLRELVTEINRDHQDWTQTGQEDSGVETDVRTRRKMRKRIRVISSSDEDENSSKITERKKNVRRNIESDFSEGSSEASSKKVREQRLRELARKRNPKKYDTEDSDLEDKCDDENASSESDDENKIFEEVTSIFTCKFSGQCQLDGCKEKLRKGVTQMIGVKLTSQPNYNSKPDLWICAKHSRFHNVSDLANEGTEEEEEDSDADLTDFIDDESQRESGSEAEDPVEEMAQITRRLSRSRPEDERNLERYLDERGKYQLEAHTPTNPALHLSEEKRLERNNRETGRDLGLNQERNIEAGDLENQQWKDVSVRGRRVRVFPDMRRMSRYTTNCRACHAQIIKNRSWVVPAQLRWRGKLEWNSRQKAFYICASHADTQESDSD